MTKMRQEKWHDRPRLERLAQVLYPHLAVNRRWIGTPYRHPKGTPLSGEFWR